MTIDLEQALLKENKKLAMPKELLLIKEYETHAGLVENDALSRVGLNKTIRQGKDLSHKISRLKQETIKFDQKRVFHVSQIEKTCNKYRLRFLPANKFEGTIDSQLPIRISTFEIASGVRCCQYSTYIMAPKESFKLEEKPKDPLFFYKINKEYYYLIHKWGNDLSASRALLPLLENPWISTLLLLFAVPMLILLFFGNGGFYVGAQLLFIALTFIIQFICLLENSKFSGILEKNKWNSEFND